METDLTALGPDGHSHTPPAHFRHTRDQAQTDTSQVPPSHRAGARGAAAVGAAELGGPLGWACRLTVTLLAASSAAAEARVLVGGREAGRGARVRIGVTLAQGPGGRGGWWRSWGLLV